MLSPSYDVNVETAAVIVWQNPVGYQKPHQRDEQGEQPM